MAMLAVGSDDSKSQAQLPPAAHPADASAGSFADHHADELSRLMVGVQAGCAASFNRLYRLARGRLLRVVLRVNKRRAEAEEILQDVFVIAWTRCRQFDVRRGSVMAWLSVIAHRQAVSSLRQPGRKLELALSQDDPDGFDVFDKLPCGNHQPPERLAQRRAAAALHACMAALAGQQRTCLNLAFFEELSHAEIALRLGQPLGTVKSWLRRAMQHMQPLMAGH